MEVSTGMIVCTFLALILFNTSNSKGGHNFGLSLERDAEHVSVLNHREELAVCILSAGVFMAAQPAKTL